MPLSKKFLLLLLPVAALAATTQVSTDKPVINFRLPTFTPEGHRSWLVRGSEARFSAKNQIEIRELTLTIYTGLVDEKIETMILSPAARVQPDESLVTGPGTIRVINDDFEASGVDWRYIHKEKRVSINQHVHVTFHAELKDFLK
ncbi:MAG: hypothetical protein PSU94_11685 [Lacunisphaera sp.]|nr:hypothetical protein [Lacunisphaera sp.]